MLYCIIKFNNPAYYIKNYTENVHINYSKMEINIGNATISIEWLWHIKN